MGASVSRNSVRLDSACEDWGSGVPGPSTGHELADWGRIGDQTPMLQK